jgi:hypothetical protein
MNQLYIGLVMDMINILEKRTEAQLAEQGWERHSTLDDPRLSEFVELYKEIGFEVHLEPIHPEEEIGCMKCMLENPEKYKTIYIRKKS